MKEHIELLKQEGLPVPPNNSDPRIIIQNEKSWQLPDSIYGSSGSSVRSLE